MSYMICGFLAAASNLSQQCCMLLAAMLSICNQSHTQSFALFDSLQPFHNKCQEKVDRFKSVNLFRFAGRKASCGHIKPAEVNQDKLSDAKAEEQFLRWFDIETGQRRLTCKSRLPIPENPKDSDRAQEYTGELLCNV